MSQTHALVIDDNRQNLKVIAQLLSKQGVDCTEVLNPIELESLLPSLATIDVVFLDLEMPGLDGFKTKDLLRDYLGNIPIIAYTVHVSEKGAAREQGFDGFLGKPLDSGRFPDQLHRILEGQAVWEI